MHPRVHLSFLSLTNAACVAILTAASVRVIHAQQESSACRLLQVAEIQAAIGGTVTAKPSGSSQSVPGMTLDECSVVLSDKDVTHPVSVRIVTNLTVDGAQAIMARNRGTASEPQWKSEGARLEQGKVGNAACILAGRPNVASHTTCSIARGKGFVEVEVIGPVNNLPSIATVGALVQKAFTRL